MPLIKHGSGASRTTLTQKAGRLQAYWLLPPGKGHVTPPRWNTGNKQTIHRRLTPSPLSLPPMLTKANACLISDFCKCRQTVNSSRGSSHPQASSTPLLLQLPFKAGFHSVPWGCSPASSFATPMCPPARKISAPVPF